MTDEVHEHPDFDPMGWWTLSGTSLMEMLRRVEAGESAEMVYAETYANSHVESYDDEG